MAKLVWVDIGELGWSLYLTAHLRWYRENTKDELWVYTSQDRECLYKDVADYIEEVPEEFYDKYLHYPQNCFGRYGVAHDQLKSFFEKYIPHGGILKTCFTCNKQFLHQTIYKPYNSDVDSGSLPKRILVFPRHRTGEKFSYRNLPKKFYEVLIKLLCSEFPEYRITTVGKFGGAYNLMHFAYNYENLVGMSSVQSVINLCRVSVGAVGGTSSLPKLALLQGVPTFIIGHEKERFMKEENWMNTRVGFFEVAKDGYNSIDAAKCIQEAIQFLHG